MTSTRYGAFVARHRLSLCTSWLVFGLALITTPARTEPERCAVLQDDNHYAVCQTILTANKLATRAEKNKQWADAVAALNTAIYSLDYVVEKLTPPENFEELRNELVAERKGLMDGKTAAEEEIFKIEREAAKAEEGARIAAARARQIQVNLFKPSAGVDVYVNGTEATENTLYVPPGTMTIGMGRTGDKYYETKLKNLDKLLKLKVEGIPATTGIVPIVQEKTLPAFDLAVGPLIGFRRSLVRADLDMHVGLRAEAIFPDLVTTHFARLRLVAGYSWEQHPFIAGGSATPWSVHSFVGGLRLTVAQWLHFSALTGVSGVWEPARYSSAAWGPTVDFSAGISHVLVNSNVWKLGLGGAVHAGSSFWPTVTTGYAITLFGYGHLNASLFAQVQFGSSDPPARPSETEVVHLPGNLFRMGSESGPEAERPEHWVLLAPFDIDRKEVTVADFRVCVQSGKCSEPETGASCNWETRGKRNHPINCVTHEQAEAYCGFLGKRLPTESEWEYAARGSSRREYPWGSTRPSAAVCWSGEGVEHTSTCESGTQQDDKTPDGVLDMGGNVSEWTGRYCNYPKATCSGNSWVSRGGSYGHTKSDQMRAGARSVPTADSLETVGFRCAR